MNSLENLNKEQYIHLTTRGRKTGKPHTVELWFALSDGKIYLSHEGKHTDWMKNLAKNGSVTAEIGGREFRGTAKIVGAGASREMGKRSLYEKYYTKGASQAVLDDWFSLSDVVEIILSA